MALFVAVSRRIEGRRHVPSALFPTVPGQQARQLPFAGVQPKIRRAGDAGCGAIVGGDPNDGLDDAEIAFRVLDERLSVVHEDVARPAGRVFKVWLRGPGGLSLAVLLTRLCQALVRSWLGVTTLCAGRVVQGADSDSAGDDGYLSRECCSGGECVLGAVAVLAVISTAG